LESLRQEKKSKIENWIGFRRAKEGFLARVFCSFFKKKEAKKNGIRRKGGFRVEGDSFPPPLVNPLPLSKAIWKGRACY